MSADLMSNKTIKRKGNKIFLYEDGKKAAKLTDTENGFHFKTYSWSAVWQNTHFSLDYAEADYLKTLLSKVKF